MRTIICRFEALLMMILLASTAVASFAADFVTLADKTDRTPIVGASVFSANGLIIGITDGDGRIEVSPRDFPLSFRSLGYDALTQQEFRADTIFMSPATYTLNEVSVSPVGRPVTRVVTYAREYCSGATPTDTLQLFSEYMLEYYFADGKVKGFSKSHKSANPLAIKRFGRIVQENGNDSIFRPTHDDDISALAFMINFASVPDEEINLEIAPGVTNACDTVQGKYFPKFIYRLNNGNFTIDCDLLADFKDHTFSPWFFKIIGMTMDMQQGNQTTIYRVGEGRKVGIQDFVYNSLSSRFLGKGKLLKKLLKIKEPITIFCYLEQYPVEIEYLTAEDYAEQKKTYHDHRSAFRVPANLQPLPPAIDALISRINSEIPND